MSFQFVQKSVTLNVLESRNSPNRGIILLNSVAFRTDYVKGIEDTRILSSAEI